MTTLADIKRGVKPGQIYQVTNHQADPHLNTPVVARVKQVTASRIYLDHALGQAGIPWPPARAVKRDEDGTVRLFGWDERAGLLEWTLTLIGDGGAA